MHSLLERALVIRTETVSRKRILDGKFTGSPITVPWSEQLRFIFGKEILSFSFPSRAPRLNTTRCIREKWRRVYPIKFPPTMLRG